jgi:hypothetical protein
LSKEVFKLSIIVFATTLEGVAVAGHNTGSFIQARKVPVLVWDDTGHKLSDILKVIS